jgi:diaminohydroxyphosphoribosylaminopyrimidine deaminase/5-amino-6-(5-phosphoribosylamino)uracil reductase
MDDRAAMTRAVELAWRGWGRVGANPLVGAVVLRDGVIVGEGWHAEFGGAHGEVAALAAAGEGARGADLVVTLEPCRHHGKTPPCAEAVIAAGVRRVVYGAADVDPQARGGAELLRRAGVAVEAGLLEAEVRSQNAVFFHRHAGPRRPFVAVKLAVTLDGRIADQHRRSRWISGEEARRWVQWLRAGYEALAVGAGTARADDPLLTARGEPQPLRPPLRIVFDRRGELPLTSRLVSTAREVPLLVVTGHEASPVHREQLRLAGAEVEVAESPHACLETLARRGVASLLVEGGGVLAGLLLSAGLVDRLYLLFAPLLLGSGGVSAFPHVPDTPITLARRWRLVGRRPLGDDTLLVLDRP